MVAKLSTNDVIAINLLSNLEEQIIYLCQKFDAAQQQYNATFPQAKRRVMELHSDFLSKSVVVQFAFPLEADTFTPEAVGEIFPSEPTPIVPVATTTVILSFQSNGDENGLFHWLGTFYGEHAWINPQTLGTLTVMMSSLASGSLSALTNRVGASALYSNSAPGQWISFDMGEGKGLKPTHYALQHDNESGYYLRNWKLQGSNVVASNKLSCI